MFEYQNIERPYPGLRPFEPWETGIFFGRDQHVDRLQDILRREHFLTVTGPSGSGKSSLVLAGLLPALPLGAIGTGSEWKLARMRPGDKPLTSLAAALCKEYAFQSELRAVSDIAANNENYDIAHVEAELRRGPLGLVDLVTDLRQFAAEPDFNLLVLVDQFEEIFTYAEAGGRQADEADALVNLLLAAGNARAANIFVIITMRTDFLGACTRFLELPAMINRSLFLTPRLNRDQLAEAIAGPARMYGLELSADLVTEYVNAGQNDPDQLPVLQHALARRWDENQQPSPDMEVSTAFATVGDLGRALSEHADAVYQSLQNDEQRLAAQWLFRAITEQRSAQAGGQAVRRPQTLDKIAAWSGRPWQDFQPVLQAFADPKVSFLTYQGEPGEPAKADATVIDISHEAVMRQWQSLKGWIENESQAAQAFAEWRERTQRKNRSAGSYLTGADLSRAETWLKQGLAFTKPSAQAVEPDSAPNQAWTSRYCSDAGQAALTDTELFIRESRKAARFLQRLLMLAAGLVVFLCLFSAGFAYDSYQKTLASAAKSLWFPIHVDSELTESGADDLLKVADQDQRTRFRFISEVLQDKTIAEVFNKHHALLLRTSLKANHKLREAMLEQVLTAKPPADSPQLVARSLALIDLDGHISDAAIANPKQVYRILLDGIDETAGTDPKQAYRVLLDGFDETTGTDQLEVLSKGSARLTDKLNNIQAAAVLPILIVTVQKTTGTSQLQVLGQALAPLAGKLTDAQAAAVLPTLIDTVQKTTGASQLQALSQALPPLAGKLTDAQTAAVVNHYVDVVQKTTEADQLRELGQALTPLTGKLTDAQATAVMNHYVDIVQKTNDAFQLHALGQALAPLTGKLTDAQAAAVMNHYVDIVQKTNDAVQLQVLSQALAPLASKLTNAQAAAVVNHYVNNVHKTTKYPQLYRLGQALPPLAGKLTDAQVAAVLPTLIDTVQKTTGASQLQVLSQALAPLAGKLTDAQAAAVVNHYVDIVQKTTEADQLRELGQALAPLTGKLTDAQAAAVVNHYVDIVQKTNDVLQLHALGQALPPLTGKLTDAQVAAVVNHYVDIVQKTTRPDQLQILGLALASLVGKLTDAQAASVVNHYVDIVQKTNDVFQLHALGQALPPLVGKLTDAQVAAVVNHYVDIVQKTTNAYQLRLIGQALDTLAGKLSDAQAAAVLPQMLAKMDKASLGQQKATLAIATNELIPHLVMNEASVRQWLRLCDNPFIDRDAVAEAIRKQYADAPKAEAGIWAFLEWANRRFSVSRPDPQQMPLIVLQLFGLPMAVFLLGGIGLHYLSGRELVKARLAKLEAARDRRGLGMRIAGYDHKDASTHWGKLGADERVIEQRFLWMDLLFPLLYGLTFAWALLQASEYLAEPIATNWLLALVGLMVVADWCENSLQLQQLRRLDREQSLQTTWIRVASLATQLKLVSGFAMTGMLAYFCLSLATG